MPVSAIPRTASPDLARTMAATAFDLGAVERVAVFRALHFGDLLCAVPALRAIRAALPHAQITLVGLPWAAEFATRFRHYIDDFLAFPGALGLPERTASAAETETFLRAAQARRFDVALQLHGSGRHSNAVVAAMGARVCAGFCEASAANPDSRRFLPYPEPAPEIRRLLQLTEFLGVPSQGEELEFPIRAAEWREAAALRASYGLHPGTYVCIHPGARAPARRWSPERFAHVADYLAARGLQVVLTGVQDEAPLTAAMSRAMQSACIDLAGQAAGGLLAALLTGAKLLVCNDTGVSHMAAALKVASVVIFTGSSPERWAPLDTERHRPVFQTIACRPCAYWVCPIGHGCAEGLLVERVVREVEEVLGGGVRSGATCLRAAEWV